MKTALPALLTVMLLLSACSQSGNKDKSENNTGTAEQSSSSSTGAMKPEKSGKIVARVNGVPIYESDLHGLPVEEVVTDEILYQKGLSEGLEKKYQDKIMQYQMSLVLREIKGKILADIPPQKEVTDQDLQNYYNSVKDLSYTNIRVEEINFADEKLGEKILKMAQEGQDFNEIAKTFPDAGATIKVNQLGFDRKLNSFFEVKEVGSISRVVKKKDGTFSVLKIQEVKIIPFENARNTIKFIVEARRKGAAYKDYARKVAKENNYKIEIVNQQNQ